jgi:DNA-binding NarL/FixJ family response regulator
MEVPCTVCKGTGKVDQFANLTKREREILKLLSTGLVNKEIARVLGITEQTVKNYMTDIMRKTGTKTRTQVAIAVVTGQINLEEVKSDAT